jgi:hypothetical protein
MAHLKAVDRSMDMKPVRIELIIDELVLHGFAPGERHAIGDAVQAHLESLLAADSIALSSSMSVDSPAPTQVVIGPRAKAGSIGSAIAQAIHGGLRR